MPELRDVMWCWLGWSERGAVGVLAGETRLGWQASRAAVMCSYRLVKCSAL